PQPRCYAGECPSMRLEHIPIPCDCFRDRPCLAEHTHGAGGGLPNLKDALARYGIAKRLQIIVIDLARVHALVMIVLSGSDESGSEKLRQAHRAPDYVP